MCEDAANNKQQTHHCGGYKAVEEISRQGRMFGGQTEEISERSRLGDGPGHHQSPHCGEDQHHRERSCKYSQRWRRADISSETHWGEDTRRPRPRSSRGSAGGWDRKAWPALRGRTARRTSWSSPPSSRRTGRWWTSTLLDLHREKYQCEIQTLDWKDNLPCLIKQNVEKLRISFDFNQFY